MNSHVFLSALAVGILATMTMDMGAILGFVLGIGGRGPRRTGPDLIGRWVGYLFRGKFRHDDILQTAPLPGEIVLGEVAHYSIGMVLTLTYIGLLVVTHTAPNVLTAMLYGVGTTALPWFVMFPSQGMGWLGRKAPREAHLARMSLYNHVLFGLGLAVWATVLRPL
jgi:DUF2938 family protein